MRILVVEDEQKLANALKKGLEQDSYAVDVVYDADDGVAYATTEEYDVVILDRMLPGSTDGLGILREMRNQNISTPVIFLTAKDKIQDKVEGLNIGADDYLVKPFSFDELTARIRALMRRPKNTESSVLKYQNLTMDVTNFQVKYDKTPVELSTKEFSLLEYLMRSKGKLVTKDSIIQHVWNFDADILPNTVEVYVAYLRNKIDKRFDVSYIKTKRGFGYVFGDDS